MIAEIVATVASGVFFGAAVYVNKVEHPARLSCSAQLAVTEWRPSYKRGTRMAPLALVGSLAALVAWWLDRDPAWMLGGLLFIVVIPLINAHRHPADEQTPREPSSP